MCLVNMCKRQASENGAAVVAGLMKLTARRSLYFCFFKRLSYILPEGEKV